MTRVMSAVALFLALGAAPAAANEVTVYTYDALGRVVSVEHPGSTSAYGYDKANNRTSFSSTPKAPASPPLTTYSAMQTDGVESVDGLEGDTNSPPQCRDVRALTEGPSFTFALKDLCDDPDGDALTLVALSPDPGVSASHSAGAVTIAGVERKTDAQAAYTVSDGRATAKGRAAVTRN